MMNKNRDIFYEEIKKGLVGPGSDTFGVDENEELISDYPLNRYYSGILFPEKTFSSGTTIASSQEERETSENLADTNEKDYDNTFDDAISIEEDREENVEDKKNEEDRAQTTDIPDFHLNQNFFFPTHIGFTFCIEARKTIEVNFSFGMYNQLKPSSSQRKIAISQEGYNSFFDETIENQLSFKDALAYSDGLMFLSRELKGTQQNPRSGEYKDYDEFRKKKNIDKKEVYNYIHLLEKLLGRAWKRQQVSIIKDIPVVNITEPIEIFHKSFGNQQLSVKYLLKTYEYKGNNYVKILLVNKSNHSSLKFSNANEDLNRKCLFQSTISIEDILLKPYKSQRELHPFDEEQNEINFIYREIKSFSVGHNCSVQWYNNTSEASENPNSIKTTFMPEKIVYGMKNDFSKEDFPNDFEALNKCLELKRLSHFNDNKKEIIQDLELFVSLYHKWINEQEKTASTFSNSDQDITNKLVERQHKNLNRLESGIKLLDSNEKVFRCFQLANTAMFIQIIISKDKRFGNKEKQLTEETENADYDSLKFFEEYSDWNFLNPEMPQPPRYRPFQLAFLLLSIEGIVNEHSDDRKNIVDLIWFPTGGGKTEAYLAVSAFTILWRRINNDAEKSKGTAIIMRYTLRLLTSQQFERASRLILALEFLRRKLDDELHDENISIGLWVGEGASPNKIQDAVDIVEKVTDYEKADQHTSRLHLTACPWCGTKFISKLRNGGWANGYECEGGAKGYFYFNCVNKKCTFSSTDKKLKLPIQVVDEMLYKEPPTLLFATVDKFAQLAWKEETNKFFNAFSEALPPDLIIQDELHLISGPLGSIVGIFESVVDYLCSKGNRRPKIIASTATTRNTVHQVKELYAGKEVNVFPPLGISYKDSFFAKESISKRKYVGFMPTGKTGLNTQLWIIPYLLYTRLKLYGQNSPSDMDLYWTIVSYYNSLKDVGKIFNKINDEIQTNTNVLVSRNYGDKSNLKFLIRNIDNRCLELTSRIESNDIKSTLKRLEEQWQINTSEKGYKYVKGTLDLVLASNMISVGIDVSRLNIMLINGMPRNIAEYIQASSRIGRKYDGIIFTFFNPSQARDKSYFENFISFHQAYYKFVEPLSVTPFTENTIRKMLATIFVAFLRNSVSELNKNADARNFKSEYAEPFKNYIISRFGTNEYLNGILDDLIKSWVAQKKRVNNLTYSTLLKKASSDRNPFCEIWLAMNSLRDIDTETYYRINDL
ncbi:MAG: helicase [Candidatus Omnitrophica bacterium]|nr:helicase [Candidatus Omnitrophota bacterium]MBU4479738.1 helicase [Candidatus Omnitrophota bacterium]